MFAVSEKEDQMNSKKSFLTYFFSIILIFFGVSGSALSATGLVYSNNNLSFNSEEIEIAASLDESILSVSTLMQDTSKGLENASLTLLQVEESLKSAQKLLGESSTAFYEIAETINFEILGYKPLEKSYSYFIGIGDSLSVLSSDIGKTAQYMNTNSIDLTKISGNLEDITININNTYKSFSGSFSNVMNLNFSSILTYVFIYTLILHIMFIIIGIVFILK